MAKPNLESIFLKCKDENDTAQNIMENLMFYLKVREINCKAQHSGTQIGK